MDAVQCSAQTLSLCSDPIRRTSQRLTVGRLARLQLSPRSQEMCQRSRHRPSLLPRTKTTAETSSFQTELCAGRARQVLSQNTRLVKSLLGATVFLRLLPPHQEPALRRLATASQLPHCLRRPLRGEGHQDLRLALLARRRIGCLWPTHQASGSAQMELLQRLRRRLAGGKIRHRHASMQSRCHDPSALRTLSKRRVARCTRR